MNYSGGFPLYTNIDEINNNKIAYKFLNIDSDYLDKDFLDSKVVEAINTSIVYEKIVNTYIPHIVEYLYLCGETPSVVCWGIPLKSETYVIACDSLPEYIKNSEFITLPDYDIYIYFKDGIKSKKLFNILNELEYLEGDTNSNKEVWMYILHESDFDDINIFMSLLFKST